MIPEEYQKYEKGVTVSVVNFNPVWGNKGDNLKKIKNMATTASQLGSNIVAFPELALSGYECGEEARRDLKPCSMHEEAAETIPGPSTEEVTRLAKKLGIYIIFGMPERDEKDLNVRYISAAVVGPEGILGRYRKLCTAPPPMWTEQVCFQRGNEVPVFETKYGPIGLLVCADFWVMPELIRILWLKGARLIFNLTSGMIGPGKAEHFARVTAARAAESSIYVASANLVGMERTLSYHGHSTIAGPAFPLLSHIYAQGEDREEIVTATLSFERLHYQWSLDDLKNQRRIHSELIINEFNKLMGS